MPKWIEQWKRDQASRRSLAIEDQRMVGAASLLSLDINVDTGRGRDQAIEDIASVRDRYGLDPDTVTSVLLELEPELAETLGC